MRKATTIFVTLLLLLMLCACIGKENQMFTKKFGKDQEYANEQLNLLLDAIENEDKESVKSLFSKNTTSNIQNFEASIDCLFEYFKGTAPAWNDQCPQVVDGENEEGNKKIIVTSSYDIKTSEDSYRISFKACRMDTANPNDVGIWSLYIISLKDDINSQHTYWGDGMNTPGINIGIKNAE